MTQAIEDVALKKRKSLEDTAQLILASKISVKKTLRELYRQSFCAVLGVETPFEHCGVPVCCNPYELVYRCLEKKGLSDEVAWGVVIFGYRFLRQEGFFQTKTVYRHELSNCAKQFIDENQGYLTNPYTVYSKADWSEEQIFAAYKKYLKAWRTDKELKWIAPIFVENALFQNISG
ncbi:hypothetical protein HY484_00845 [Candidatus Woesearchaeota archaeon]|nr:hypothetical protein [Candidatus Woesearchaeota archaeon]